MLKSLQARLQQYVNSELTDVQAGFRKGRGTRDQIANICWIIEKAREFQKNIYFCFTDYAKAFDCMDHNKLWKILEEMGIPDHLTCLLRNLYTGQEATVRTGHGTTDWFQIGKGVRQGSILSPCLFNLYAEHAEKAMATHFVLLPAKSHGWRSLVGCSPWGHEESDTTERLYFHFSLSCIGEGNGNPLQCSCLENPRDGGAWQAAVYGVARNRTRLKRLSSSSSSRASQRAVKNLAECRRRGLYPWVRKIPWRSTWQPTPVFLPGEFHGQKILVGYRP